MMSSSTWNVAFLSLQLLLTAVNVLADTHGQILPIQTGAVCGSAYNWMQNSKHQSPCLVAAYLLGACTSNNWDLPSLPPNTHYNPPNSTNVNGCQCSWSAYNLLSACTVCQNNPSLNWDNFRQACTDQQASVFFPADFTIPSETAIPYWAITNPTTWNDDNFDQQAAYQISQENKPDITSDNRGSASGSKKKPIAAIAGGVVGGLALLGVVVCIIAFFVFKSKQEHDPVVEQLNQLFESDGSPRHGMRPPGWSISTFTHRSRSTNTRDHHHIPPSTMSHVPGESVSSFSDPSRSLSVAYHNPSGSESGSPSQPLMRFGLGSQRRTERSVVEPFFGAPSRFRTIIEKRRSAGGALHAVNQAPTPPPGEEGDEEEAGEATRMNPPAYTPHPEPVQLREPARSETASTRRYGHRRGLSGNPAASLDSNITTSSGAYNSSSVAYTSG